MDGNGSDAIWFDGCQRTIIHKIYNISQWFTSKTTYHKPL